MKLYLVQHGKAVSKEQNPERPLSPEGQHEVQKVAEFIKPLGITVDYLWHSDKKRAIQTAEILAETIKVNKEQSIHSGLGPNDDVTVLEEEIALSKCDIMVVGHLPFLGKLASLLLASSESAVVIKFKNAGIVCLNYDSQTGWQTEWIVTPEIIP